MQTPLARDIAWLNARLKEVGDDAAPDGALDRTAATAAGMLETGQPDECLAALTEPEIHAALKTLTTRFHLRNKAEQVHIARVNRERAREASPDTPRPESLSEAIGALASRGVSRDDVLAILHRLDIGPTLTAHPTESRRRSVMQKQSRIADLLARENDSQSTPAERAMARSAVRQTLALLLATDEVRSRRLQVIDEVRNGINYLAGAIWDAVPRLYRDLASAFETHYGERVQLPVLMRYRSWIGGDRDGNPSVTADVTKQAFDEMRAAAVARHAEALETLRRELSISDRRVPISDELRQSIDRDQQMHTLAPERVHHLQHEPFRVKIRHMQARLGSADYSAADFCDDLDVLDRALVHAGLEEVAHRGLLADMLVQARTFGFHLATLDVRQHSRVHEAAVAELLRVGGVADDYDSRDVQSRIDLLRHELATSRPLCARGASLSDATAELLATLDVIASAVRSEPLSVGSYIVSMAHDTSDMLEVLILLREAGLWRIEDGVAHCAIDVVPLFETVDDLANGANVLNSMFNEPAYAAQLAARGNFQEIMLGYSDSNKDGGYWAANWRLHRAQDELARVCIDAGVSFRFFHGRGGTVARGGGRAHRAILANPARSRNGRIRFTEQGEVISFRYAMPEIAQRHLEQIVNAMILGTADDQRDSAHEDARAESMEFLADRSREAYRELVDDPAFWPWFVERSPVLHIGALPIASRPVSRAGGRLNFDNLRAIPWVFAWTQMRYNAPGWYGMGTAFAALFEREPEAIEACRVAYAGGGCFRAFIDNAQQEMARARLAVARWYAGEEGDALHEQLAAEFGRARDAVLAITGQDALLDNNRVIQQSIRERNPDTDTINALQIELLSRWRRARDADDAEAMARLRQLILLSVNALAAAMQSTG